MKRMIVTRENVSLSGQSEFRIFILLSLGYFLLSFETNVTESKNLILYTLFPNRGNPDISTSHTF